MKVFICWSEDRSRVVAETLRSWLKGVIQELKPFLSTQDIRSGKRWMSEIAGELAETKFGVLCLTPENLGSPWLHFEAGALSKTIDDKTFVSPYLIGGLTAPEVPDPLGQFQSNPANKEGTWKLIETINSALSDKKLEKDALKTQFEKYWLDLEKVLQNLPEVKGKETPKRQVGDMVGEILETVRGLAFTMQKREEINPAFFTKSLSDIRSTSELPTTWEDITRLMEDSRKREGVLEGYLKAEKKREEERVMKEELKRKLKKVLAKKIKAKRAEKEELKKKADIPH